MKLLELVNAGQFVSVSSLSNPAAISNIVLFSNTSVVKLSLSLAN